MDSSTSNSEAGASAGSGALPTVLGLVARAAVPSGFVAVLLLFVALRVANRQPATLTSDIEGTVIGVQLERAPKMGAPDILIVGDSSALMGVDAIRLGVLLGDRHVESLATFGHVGPAGYAHELELYANGRRSLPTILVLMHGVSLKLTDREYETFGVERAVLTGTMDPRTRIFDRLMAPVLYLPLPGSYGREYGWPEDLAAALQAGQGSIVDPNTYEPADAKVFRYEMTPAVARRLDALGATIGRLGAANVLVGVTPMPSAETDESSVRSRAEVQKQLASRVGASEIIKLPASMRDDEFATQTHLSAKGRAKLTEVVAAELERLRAERR
jgi:hypothetical protein